MSLYRLKLFAERDDNGRSLQCDGQHVYGIRTITLDLDDTLWEIGPVIRRAERCLHHWLAEYYPRIVEMHAPEHIVELRAQVVSEFQDRSHDLTFVRRTVLARMGVAAGYGDDFVDDAFAVFDRERNTVELYPETRPVLESLASRYTLVAVTNGNARLDRIGIDDLFDAFVSASSAGAPSLRARSSMRRSAQVVPRRTRPCTSVTTRRSTFMAHASPACVPSG